MPARRRRKRRRTGGLWPPVELPTFEQRHWDLIGLGLVAFAAFFACVFYLGWAGGEVGEAMADGILFLFGGAGYLAPVALFAAGALIVVRPMLPAVHPLKTGALCLAAALTLGLAAGSLGLGPGDTPRDGFLDAGYLREHGGLVGESLLWASSTLFSEVGSHILFMFLLLAGTMLVTGASIAGVVQATREAAASTGAHVRRTSRSFSAVPTAPLPGDPIAPARGRVEPPEPEDAEPVVRATHVEAPALDEEELTFEQPQEEDAVEEEPAVPELEPPAEEEEP